MTTSVVKQCVVVTCFSENQPGYMDFSYRLQALAKHYRLTVLSQDVLTQEELRLPNVQYLTMGRRNGKLGWVRYLFQCATYIRSSRPDVAVLLHSGASPITLLTLGTPSWLYWNEHPTNLVHFPEGNAPFRRVLACASHRLVFLGARYASMVMPIGEEHRDDLLKQGCMPTRVCLNYMGVSDSFSACAIHKTRDTKISLIYIGSISGPRGRDVMLEGMADVIRHQDSVHLTMVGADPEQLAYCGQRISQLGLESHVEVLGRVPGHELPALLAKADMGICLWEDRLWWRYNPPTKLFEYLVAGLPVLASDIRTHTRYIRDGHNGLIFDYSVKGFSSIVQRLVTDRSSLDHMRNQALIDGQQYLWSRIEPAFLSGVAGLVRV